MSFVPGTPSRLVFLAGQERGIRISYMARAKAATENVRVMLVRHARQANHEMVRYLRAARAA